MQARWFGTQIRAVGFLGMMIILGLSGLFPRESRAQPPEDPAREVPKLIAELKDEDPNVRRSAAEGLRDLIPKVEDATVLEPAIQALR